MMMTTPTADESRISCGVGGDGNLRFGTTVNASATSAETNSYTNNNNNSGMKTAVTAPRREGCGYCGALQCPDGTPLLKCDSCDMAYYCELEHQKFHWKLHKVVCKTAQFKKERQLAEQQRLEGGEQSTNERGQVVAHQTDSRISLNNPSTSSSAPHEKIIATDDPDIQIIETPNMPPPPTPPPQRGVKRAGNDISCANGRVYKDHSKNLLFKTTLQQHVRMLQENGMVVNQHQAIALRIKYISEHVIRSLNEYGWCVVDHFLGDTHCRHIYQEVDQLFKRGLFGAGQLMDHKKTGPSGAVSSSDVRSDETYWFDSGDEPSAVTVRLLVSLIDSVVAHFSGRIPPYKIKGRSRPMIACYPGNGTRYVKHVDNPIKDGRCITSIYYCNENWDLSKHGGTLRLYPESSAVPMDVDPQGDRLVFFWSDRRNPHEVLPVNRHRFAITIWYFDESEKTAAMDRLKSEEARSSMEGLPPPPTRPKVDDTMTIGGTDLTKSSSDVSLKDMVERATVSRSAERIPTRARGSSSDTRGGYRHKLNRATADHSQSSSADSDENQDDNQRLPKASALDPEYQI